MGIMVYSLLWVMQDLYDQPLVVPTSVIFGGPGFELWIYLGYLRLPGSSTVCMGCRFRS